MGGNCDLVVMGTHGRTGVAHLLLGSVAVLGRVGNGRYLRPVVTFLSKVPLFKRWFQRASIAALERQNPELAAAMRKIHAFGEPKTPEQAQRMPVRACWPPR